MEHSSKESLMLRALPFALIAIACTHETVLEETTRTRIGAGGGSLVSADGKVSLTVPAGALTGDVEIAIQPVDVAAPSSARSRVYELTPHGQQFLAPVTLAIEIDR